MGNNKACAAAMFIVVTASALILFADANANAKADAIWTVGSQISQIAASEDNVYVLWQNNSPDQNVYFRRSTDNGATFEKVVLLSNAVSGGFASDPQMAISGNYVYVAWMDTPTGETSKVLFRRSMDGGATFESPQVLSNNPKGSSGIQQLLSSGNKIYALLIDEWAEQGDYYYDANLRVSRDNGKTFSEPISLLPHLSQSNMRSVSSMAVRPHAEGDTIYVVGVDYGDCTPEQVRCGLAAKIFFRKSEDGGKVFSDPAVIERPSETLAAPDELRVEGPSWLQVSADNRYVTIIWADANFLEGRQAIFMASSSDKGKTFSEVVQLDKESGSGSSDFPILVSTHDSTLVAWNSRDQEGNYPNVALVKIDDGSFTAPVNVSGRITIPYWHVSASEKNVYAAWNNSTKNIDGLPNGNDVYFASSADGGKSFGNPIDLSNDNAIKTLFATQQKPLSFVAPKVAVFGTHVYVGWQASYPDSHEIFLTTSSDSGHTFGRIINLNEEAGDPASRGLSFFATYGIYLILSAAAVIAVSVGVLFAKHRGETRW